MKRIARRLPTPTEDYHGDRDCQTPTVSGKAPTTLRTAVKVFPEIVRLSEQEHEEFWVAVELEGALHNRIALPDNTIDVIIIVDNA